MMFAQNGTLNLMVNSPNNTGRDFWFAIPPSYTANPSPTNFVQLHILSDFDAEVIVEIPNKDYKETINITKGRSNQHNIQFNEAFPVSYTGSDGPLVSKVFKGAGIHIYSKAPLIVYVVVQSSFATDGFLLIPTSDLGTEYVGTSYNTSEAAGLLLPGILGITAAYDGTEVEFTVGGNAETQVQLENDELLSYGETKKFNMNKGDVLLMSDIGQGQTMSGSYINSNLPVSMMSAHFCANVPVGNFWCDYNIEMDIPMNYWGKMYPVPFLPAKKFNGIIRIFAKEDNTTVFRDGEEIGNIANGKKDYIEMRVWDKPIEPKESMIHADKAINVMYYCTGLQEDENTEGNALDPFSMQIMPLSSYSNEFTTIVPRYSTKINQVALIFQLDQDGDLPDYIQIAKYENETFDFEPVNIDFGVDYINFFKEGTSLGLKIIDLQPESVYKFRSDFPMMVYAYGGASYDSYGFPAAGSMTEFESGDIAPPVVPDLVLECNGTKIKGSASDDPNDPENTSYLSDIYFDGNYSTGRAEINFSKKINDDVNEIPFETSSVDFDFEVENPEKPSSYAIVLTDRAGNKTMKDVNYSPVSIAMDYENTNNIIQFDMMNISKEINFENTTDREITIYDVLFEGDNGFELNDFNGEPILIPASGTYKFTVNYTGDNVDVNDKILFDLCYKTEEIGLKHNFGASSEFSMAADEYLKEININETTETTFDLNFDVCNENMKTGFTINEISLSNADNFSYELMGTELGAEVDFESISNVQIKLTASSDVVGTFSTEVFIDTEGEELCEGVNLFTLEAKELKSVNNIDDNLIINYDKLSNKLNITSQKSIISIKIIDMLGKQVYNNNEVSKNISLDVDNYSKGNYIIRIESGGQTIDRNIMID